MKMKAFFSLVTVLVFALMIAAPAAVGAEEPVHLVWWTYSDSGDAPAALKDVLEKANAISAEKIGVTVDLLMKTDSQFALDLNTDEYYDMIFTCDWCNSFDTNAQRGYYYDITDLVQTETATLYEAIDPWWDIGTLKDRIYGVPMLKDLGAEVFFRVNSDYFEGEKGLELPEEISFADLEPLLAMYKKDHPTEYPLYLTKSGPLGMFQTHERIVGNYLVIPYNRVGTPDGTKIVPVWDDEEYMEKLRCLHRWYELGYINPDAATVEDMPYSLMNPIRTGTAWTGYKGWSNPEIVGFNVKLVRFIGPNMSRSTQQGSLIAINAAASEEHAKACLKYMELLYTDRELRDTLAYGIEGRHFNYYEGTVIRTELGSEEYTLDNFQTGPAVSASVVSANENNLADPDQWKKVYEGYQHAKMSDTQGFSFDSDTMEAERSVLSALWNNHLAELVTGTIDPDEAMAAVRKEMEEAGLLKVQEEAQRQLDEYLESRK